jgi:hypothetical protein
MANQDDQARKHMTQQRQHDTHVQHNMQGRAKESVSHPDGENDRIQAEARESGTNQRQHETHVKDSMRERSEEEINP